MLAVMLSAWPAVDVFAQLPTGILKSRWAMDDPKYSRKYAEGAEKTDIPGKIKQAADARFIKDAYGIYVSGGLSAFGESTNPMASMEVGVTGYNTSYFTHRMGLVAAVNADDFFLGAEMGMRFQTPTRLAPFVGVGLFTGAASTTVDAEDDRVDNDDDGFVDEFGEEDTNFDGALSAAYPEAGVHFWWTPQVRLSGFGRYLITTGGRDTDSWFYGASIAFLK